ncbi:thioredoxin [Bacteroides caecigallinarum]|uniref:thioredoxin n=1 Tax=Bacteroides TaxID=816 RepID=UPI001957575D|nr:MULTISPECIES: thioredoxin [Bacteroides]MBM6960879.1 thioredoxin [Bacteroides caecigallinarum]MCF2737068.1 thioredoxin [Bacteroides caecigallinarum]MCR8894635.1 thioredoxin [Bacteroides sp. ET336]MDN0053202.1 thioredoxin [Bacteroides caecigallinarum]MDN0059131.1 thioredoxin [Bacteroides caecigallinarum]
MKRLLFFLASAVIIALSTKAQSVSSDSNGKVIHIGKTEFVEKIYDYEKNPDKWIYNGKKPAIVDFYADWCGPCRMLSPTLESLAQKYKDKIIIYKVNTDKERELAAAFGITSLPTLLFIPMDKMPQVAQGALPKEDLEKAINDFLLK